MVNLLLTLCVRIFNGALCMLPEPLEVSLEIKRKKKKTTRPFKSCAFILKAATGSQSLPFDLRLRFASPGAQFGLSVPGKGCRRAEARISGTEQPRSGRECRRDVTASSPGLRPPSGPPPVRSCQRRLPGRRTGRAGRGASGLGGQTIHGSRP